MSTIIQPSTRRTLDRHRRGRRFAEATLAWAVLYGGLRVWYATGHRPHFAPMPTDLVGFTGWGAVTLYAAVAVTAAGLRWHHGWCRTWWVTGWALTVLVVSACALVLLDLVGVVLWGIGIPHNPVSIASRLGCLLGAGLLAATTTQYRRSQHPGCPRCARTGPVTQWDAPRCGPPPRWAQTAAYLAVAGMITRFAAQAIIGFGARPFTENASATLFDVGFVLAGSLLPLALVHRWGRIWPRWVLPLAGRTVPRWLVAGPALVLSAGLTAYFGVGTEQLLIAALGGPEQDNGGLSLVFMWIAVPSYLVWGLAMGAAAISYHQRTRSPCRTCGR